GILSLGRVGGRQRRRGGVRRGRRYRSLRGRRGIPLLPLPFQLFQALRAAGEFRLQRIVSPQKGIHALELTRYPRRRRAVSVLRLRALLRHGIFGHALRVLYVLLFFFVHDLLLLVAIFFLIQICLVLHEVRLDARFFPRAAL